MLRLRTSKLGLTLVATFMFAAVALFAVHWRSLHANGGDVAESTLLFFFLTLPWAYLVPDSVINATWWGNVSYYVGWIFIGLNAFLIYCLTGGLGFTVDDRAPRRYRRPDPHAVRDG